MRIVMDGALLLIAGNMAFPQLQTKEHLMAIELMELKNIIILQVRAVYRLYVFLNAFIIYLIVNPNFFTFCMLYIAFTCQCVRASDACNRFLYCTFSIW